MVILKIYPMCRINFTLLSQYFGDKRKMKVKSMMIIIINRNNKQVDFWSFNKGCFYFRWIFISRAFQYSNFIAMEFPL